LVELLGGTAEKGKFLTKGESLVEIERYNDKILNYGWVQTFLARHAAHITTRTIHLQEDARFHLPQQFLNDCLDLVCCHVTGMNSRLIYNIDETGCSDWEGRRNDDGTVPMELADEPIDFIV
jgi:hypothetical protein